MRKMLLPLCLGVFLLQSNGFAMERCFQPGNDEPVTVVDTLSLVTFPITRVCLSERGIFYMILPGAFLVDGALAVGGAVATPLVAAKQLLSHTKDLFAKFYESISDSNLDDVSMEAVAGYQQRFIDLLTLLEDRQISAATLPILVLAQTAHDSAKSAPKMLILGTGQELTKKSLKKAPEEWRALYDQVAKASTLTSSFKEKKDLVSKLAEYFAASEDEKQNSELRELAQQLEQASQKATHILKGLQGRQ